MKQIYGKPILTKAFRSIVMQKAVEKFNEQFFSSNLKRLAEHNSKRCNAIAGLGNHSTVIKADTKNFKKETFIGKAMNSPKAKKQLQDIVRDLI